MKALVLGVWIPLAIACANRADLHPASADPIASIQASTTKPITADTADVVISRFDRPTPVRVGQTIGLKPMRDGARWQVSFSTDHLQLLTPASELSQPGEGGWVWRATAEGDVDMTFTMLPDCSKPPCAPNVMQVTVSLEVSK